MKNNLKNMKLNYKNAWELTADPSKKHVFQFLFLKKNVLDVFGHKHAWGSLKNRFDGLEL